MPAGLGTGPTQIDFMVNNLGQVGIGGPCQSSTDLFVYTHHFPASSTLAHGFWQAADDNGTTLFCLANVGSASQSSGYLFVKGTSVNPFAPATTINPAFAVLDASHNLNPILEVTGTGLMGMGINANGIMAQLDVVQNNNTTDYLFHIQNMWAQDVFSVDNSGFVGIGKLNSGAALVDISDASGWGGIKPLLLIDDGAATPHPYFQVDGNSSGVNVGIGISPGYSTLAMKGIGGTSLDLYCGAASATGWDNQIRFFNHEGSAIRHIITDDYGSNNLVISPGYMGNANSVVQVNGSVIIGDVPNPCASSSCYSLYVQNGILSERYKCALASSSDWSDYVFGKDYKIMSIDDLDSYIKQSKHLPGIPTAEETLKEGIDLGQMDAKLLAKVEELTLYIIKQQHELDALKKNG